MHSGRILILIIGILFIPHIAECSKEDSLNAIIKKSTGKVRANALFKLAEYYKTEDLILKAEDAFDSALRFINKLDAKDPDIVDLKMQIMTGMAEIYLFNTAEYEKSVNLLHKTLKLAKKYHDSIYIVKTTTYLGFNYRFIKKYKEALKILDEAITMSELIRDTNSVICAMNEKANVYYFLGKERDSEKLHIKALGLAGRTRNEFAQHYIWHDLAFLFINRQNYKQALEYFILSHNYDTRMKDKRQMCISAINIGEMYLQLNLSDSALFYFKKAERIAKRNNFIYEISLAYEGLSQYYVKESDFENAYLYLKKNRELSDTIFNLENEKQITDILARYESDLKDQENKMLKQSNLISNLELEKGRLKYRTTVITALVVTVFILILFYILFRANLRRKMVNEELEKKNQMISMQKDHLVETLDYAHRREKELEEANAAKNKFFSIIAHDLKNPFSAIMGLSALLKENLDTFSKDDIKDIVENIATSSDNIYKLLENLLQWARTQTNRIDVEPENFNVSEIIKTNIGLFKELANKKNVSVQLLGTDPVFVNADPGMVDFVIRNLLANAVKFVHKGGMISFDVKEQDGTVKVGVIDNGVGISEDNLEKLFRIDGKVKTAGTENEKGSGLGLIICKEFIQKNMGEIWAESIKNKGSSFYFTLPKAKLT